MNDHDSKFSTHPRPDAEGFEFYFTDPGDFITDELRGEITDLATEGYDISLGNTSDQAYERPDKVTAMYHDLSERGRQFTQLKREIVGKQVGWMVHGRKIHKAIQKENEDIIEKYRVDQFFSEGKGQPWHDQRGCATALLTIMNAHELSVEGSDSIEGDYSTLSAMLDPSLLAYRFEDGNSLTGMTIREAIINTGGRFYGINPESAGRYADKRLSQLEEFVNAPVTERFKEVVQYCTDSLGIRSRKQEVRIAINNHIDEKLEREPNVKEIIMMSVGCGTALSMLEVADDIKAKGVSPKLILIDQDPIALASALHLARKMHLEDCVEIHCERMFSRLGRPIDMRRLLRGNSLDVCEDTGLREYLPDRVYKALTKEIWSSLAGDGLMTTGNMNVNRIQSEFLHGLMGWSPKVQMREIKDGIRLHHEAGVPKEAMRVRLTQDGIYTLYFSSKKFAKY